MYTQCPDCEIAFKVTADVLKQAAGKVRCGGCGNAFNALAYLSERMPKQPVAQKINADVPELEPEIIDTDDGLPQSISAEQSAALLKTLDELAGSDIRIEDTGVEWRILDDQEAAEPAADDDDAGPDIDPDVDFGAEIPATNVDEFLDDAETPIDEFLTATPDVVDAPEFFEEVAGTAIDELRFDDNTPLPDDFDLEVETPSVTKPATEAEDESLVTQVEEPQPEISLSEPDEWTDILVEFEELVEEVAVPTEHDAVAIEGNDEDSEPVHKPGDGDLSTEQPLDVDSQFALQAEAMGIDLSGIGELDEPDEIDDLSGIDEFDEPDEIDDLDEPDERIAQENAFEEDGEFDIGDEPESGVEADTEAVLEDEIELEMQLDLIDEPDGLIEEPIIESHTIETELAGLGDGPESPDSANIDGGEDRPEQFIPPLTEEEHTVNMQIDQDLMALAIEDEDGFASTIVMPEGNAEEKSYEEEPGLADNDSEALAEEAGFETIIMEGEFIRSTDDSDKLATDVAEAAALAAQARTKEAEETKQSGNRRYGMIAGAVGLVLLLVIQVMHQSREALATIPAFNSTIGKVYRAIGQPVQPAWDITGWRFEATKGSTEGEGDELTVYSRLGNDSDGPLPYPLIGISLTDRFEETIGSRILDPAEYLPTDLDPRKLVEPGNTFNAVITIKSTSEDATGFKLNVCYRVSGGQLRCAIDDFK